jgi:pimeloyl-ACP methyl ester carboxylesterase
MNKKAGTVIAVAGIATITIHLINRAQFSMSTVKNVLSGPNNNYYEWRFGKIRFIRKGSGSPLLLLHDLTIGSSSYEYRELIDSLSQKHEVFAIDLLGYGLSDKPNITYTNYLYVQSVIDFIKNIIGKKTSVLASGDSAAIAVMAAHNDGEVIDKIALISPQSLNKMNQIPNRQTKLLKFLIDTPIIGTFVYNMLTTKEAFKKNFRESFYASPSLIEDELAEAYNEAAHLPDCTAKYSFASYVSRFMNANIIHALKQVDHSIYLIYGTQKEDNQTIIDNYLYYNQSIERFPITGTSQLPHLEKPKEVLEQLDIIL